MGKWNPLLLRCRQMVGDCGAQTRGEGGEYSQGLLAGGHRRHRTPVLTRLICRSQLISNKLTENP